MEIGQPSYFLAETLKYMLLIVEPDLLPIAQYVMTTEAHPLSVRPLQCGTALCRDEYTRSASCHCEWDALMVVCVGLCCVGCVYNESATYNHA